MATTHKDSEPSFMLWATDPDAPGVLLDLAERKRARARTMSHSDRTQLLREATKLEERAWDFQDYAREAANAG